MKKDIVDIIDEEFINDRLQNIYKVPEMWGDMMAVEMQILLLLDLRMFINGYRRDVVMEEYRKFLPNALPTSQRVKTMQELVAEMKRFEKQIESFLYDQATDPQYECIKKA